MAITRANAIVSAPHWHQAASRIAPGTKWTSWLQHAVCKASGEEDKQHGEVRSSGFEAGEVGDAPQEEGDTEERFGPEGHQSQAGDCDRPE
jgi:hypothetical protein